MAPPALPPAGRRTPFDLWRVVFLLLGLGLLFILVRQAGLGSLLQLARQVGWTFPLIVGLYGGVHLLRTVSWRLCLREEGKRLPLGAALNLWIAGEAVAHLSFAWAGEPFRAAATSPAVPAERGLSALIVSRMLYSYASLLLMALSAILCLFLLRLSEALQLVFVSAAVILVALCALPFLGLGRPAPRRTPELPSAPPAGGLRSSVLARVRNFLRTFRTDLAAVFGHDRRTFLLLLSANFLAALAGVAEVYLVLRSLGTEPSLATALIIEGANKVLAVFAFFIPANLGVREGGTALVLRLFNLSSAVAITLVLVRRARALVWVGIGGLLLLRHGMKPVLGDQPPPPVATGPH
ncbi:MAG: lysylphosphatidylglycerol synthase transmembrane domain-containing protein [Candidatus Acidiferrales bacterium]